MSQSNDKKCNIEPQGASSGGSGCREEGEIEELHQISNEESDFVSKVSTATEVVGKTLLYEAVRGKKVKAFIRTSFAVLACASRAGDDHLKIIPVVERNSAARHRSWRAANPGEQSENHAEESLRGLIALKGWVDHQTQARQFTESCLSKVVLELSVAQNDLKVSQEQRLKLSDELAQAKGEHLEEKQESFRLLNELKYREGELQDSRKDLGSDRDALSRENYFLRTKLGESEERVAYYKSDPQGLEERLDLLKTRNESLSARVSELESTALSRPACSDSGDDVDGEHRFSLNRLTLGPFSLKGLSSHLICGKSYVGPELPGTDANRKVTTDVWSELSAEEKFFRLVRRREEVERSMACLKVTDALLRFEGRTSSGEQLHYLQIQLADTKTLLKELNMAVDKALQKRVLPEALP